MEAARGVGSSSNVTELLGRLKLTPEESDALTVDDVALEGLVTSDLAVIGKVLSPSILHIQTIIAAQAGMGKSSRFRGKMGWG